MEADQIKELVRDTYAAAALRVAAGESNGCCGGAASSGADPITSNLYSASEMGTVPDQAARASLGCGNPTALADLRVGDIVLDLGSGGGIDVLLSARRVGPTGKAYGLDMTDEMLAMARRNQADAGIVNAEFLRGEIEKIPLPDNSIDVIISNCVINLSGDKQRVISEAFRVLKPGGRFAVSDVVVRGTLPAEVLRSMELWVGCVAGALPEARFLELLDQAGFVAATIEPTRVYEFADAKAFLEQSGLNSDSLARDVSGRVMGAFVRALKPVAKSCCGPECCA
jgi:SAM-dependent methyltransferase